MSETRVVAYTQDGKILLKGEQRDPLLTGIPGGIYDPKAGAWRFRATPAATQNILDAFAGRGSHKLSGTSEFRVLVQQAKDRQALQALKESAAGLSDIGSAKIPPRAHQIQSFHFVKDLPAGYLALQMACGKTSVAIHVATEKRHRKILVVAPMSVVSDGVWPAEFEKHSKRQYKFCTLDDSVGTVKDKMHLARLTMSEAELLGLPCVIIVNYESVWREPFGPAYKTMPNGNKRRINKGWALEQEWDLIIADEIHRIQSHNGKASCFMGELGSRAKQRLGLSGTPFSSGPLSVFGQFRFLDPSIYGTRWEDFKCRYAVMGGYNNHSIKDFQNLEELQRKFYSIAFRVETRDVLDLPAEQHITHYCTLGKEGARAYKEMEKDFVARVREGEVTASNALVKLLRLQQMTSGYARLDSTDAEEGQTVRVDDSKRKLLDDLLTDLDLTEPVVVFARFRHDLDAIREVAKKQGRTYFELSGKVKETQEWRRDGKGVLGVQIGAGAEGVDLTLAHYCIYYSLGYSLGSFEQSQFRVMRPNQKSDVVYMYLIAKGTVDEKVHAALRGKKEVVDSILSRDAWPSGD